MIETPFFFARGAARLFGLLHAPDVAEPKTAFVMSHPFAEEKLWSHRVFVSFAREAAKLGYPVLRFDYQGAGDSSGQVSDTSLDSHVEDLLSAIDALRERYPEIERIGLVGLRLGATFAALACERVANNDSYDCVHNAPLILWEPVTDGEAYFQEVLRSNLSTQLAVYGEVRETRDALQDKIRDGGTVNVDGYDLGKELFESCALPEVLSPAPKQHLGPTLVVQIAANDRAKDRDNLVSLAGAYGKGTFLRSIEHAFWREIKLFYGRADNLQQATLAWLEQ